jgi:hypothetical protein
MRASLRACDLDCAGPLVVREISPAGPEAFRGRDLTKVAQYPAAADTESGFAQPSFHAGAIRDSGVVYCSWKNSTLEFSALSQG